MSILGIDQSQAENEKFSLFFCAGAGKMEMASVKKAMEESNRLRLKNDQNDKD